MEKSHYAQAASKIKQQLSNQFPGIKFSVRSESYSGGNSININWDLGPTVQQVKKISDSYQEGNFNGMIDLYEYNRSPTAMKFQKENGSAKYVFENRHIPEPIFKFMVQELCRLNNVPFVDPYYNIHFEGYSEFATTIIHRIFSNLSLPARVIIEGLERTDCTCGRIEEFYRVKYHVDKITSN